MLRKKDIVTINCKQCNKKLMKKDALIHEKVSWDNIYLYKDKKVKLWYFCDGICQFEFLNNRGKK